MRTETQQPTINPTFAGYAAKYLREASDDLQRVFDNLLEIASGDVPDAKCENCEDGYLCEIHDPESEYYDDGEVTDEEIDVIARGMRNIMANRGRLYMDPADGRLKLRPPDPVDDS